MSTFAPLHVHSHYSLLKALPKIPELVAAAKDAGCEAMALTDLHNLYGAIEFYKECTAQGIKPIIGVDAALMNGERLILLAKDNGGYQNLLALLTRSHLEASGTDKPALTPALLREHAEGLIALLPAGKHVGIEYLDCFATEDVYADAALQEIFYLKPADRRAWETMCAIENRGPADESSFDEEKDFSFLTAAQLEKRYGAMALDRTREVAARCNVSLSLGSWIFPPYPIPENTTYDKELRRAIEEGLARRSIAETPEMRSRIEYEYKIICDKGYSPYFLVVSDLLAFAREHGILATTRGSAGGSLISYLIGITTINPLDYKLPFERFLNPERPKAPDIDMDYADNRRDEIIEYAHRKYGNAHVAQIGTFGTMLARGVVRDVARALGYPYGVGDRIAKAVPFGSQGFPMTLARALEESPDLAKMYKSERDVKEIIDLGKKIEGCARHISVHAAGVVISPKPLVLYAPLQRDPKGGKIITQYDMYSITDEYGGVGLLKFDFLGIRNLSILARAVELVKTTRGIAIDIENVPLDDAKTFEMLARGETEGLFQLGGAGMTRYLKELRPTTIHDINAMVALFRPGPMETIPAYIERKHNPSRIAYLDPRMKEYLDFSYGVLVYQDDVLLTAIKIAGYSWLEADNLRKAMGKKIPEEMQAQKKKFMSGAVENGMAPAKADQLWKLIEPFAAYGFGKAHAASYGKVAYQTAYMKANFPVEYMTAVLSAEAGDVDTVGIMVAECKRMGIPVLPPDINESFGDFTAILGKNAATEEAKRLAAGATEDAIRFGLYSIKNFGQAIADAIIAERKKGGRFSSLSDFLSRLSGTTLNKKSLEALVQCGALDGMGERGQMMAGVDQMLQFLRESGADAAQDSLFGAEQGASEVRLPEAPPCPPSQKLAWEKELLGLYVSGHPLDEYREKLARRPMTIGELREKARPGMTTVTGGIIEDIRTILTRSGDQMAFVKVADASGSIEAVLFPRSFTAYKAFLEPQKVIALKGRLSNRNGEVSLVAEAVKAL